MLYHHSPNSADLSWTSRCFVFVALFALAALPAWSQVSSTLSTSTRFRPHTPRRVQDGTATLVGHYNPNQMLRLTLGLQPPHVDEERQFLESLQTKGSHDFHQFLSAEEWTTRFDPSVEDEQAVVDWATAQGLTVTHRFPNRLLVDVEGTAGTIEKAFGVTINSYQVGTKTIYSNDRDPQIPLSLIDIVHSVGGLNNLEVMHPANKNMKEPVFPDYVPGPVVSAPSSSQGNGNPSKRPQSLKALSSGPMPSYTTGTPYDPQDMYSTAAYDVGALYNLGHCCNPTGNAGGSPPETSIAIATAGSQLWSDVNAFQNFYGLAYNENQLGIDGQSVPCTDTTGATCDGEGTMDMEWSTAMSNSFGSYLDTSHVWMYDGVNANFSTFNDIYNHMLTDGAARNFSTSWGCEETYCYDNGDMDTADSIFASMVGQGWSLTAASGDHGATANCDDLISVMFPASDPNVVGAGGTTMYLSGGPPPSFISFTAWGGGPAGCALGNPRVNDGGSTGGYSSHWAAPSFQSGFPSRGVPDIALNADWYNTPQWMYFSGFGGWNGNGGTSIVAPETVGFFAQENAYLLALGNICGSGSSPCAPMGAVNPYLYEEYNHQNAKHYPFYDITTGNNCNDVTSFYGLGCWSAGTGWDPVTGLGTYNFLQLAWTINWDHVPGVTYPTVAFSGPATSHWYNSDQIVSWTVSAPPGNGFPSDGTAGFSQAWDSDPGDPYRQATPGLSGFPGSPYNAFYDGPQYPNATAGCLDFTGASCAGSVGQGWHTVNVRAWGNEGENGGDYTYGPIGYDTIAPVTTASLSGTLVSGSNYKSAVKVTLTATDPGAPATGSGVAHTVYQINTEGLRTYSGPFTVSYPGTYTVTFYSTDVSGNIETTKSVGFTISSVIAMSPTSLAFGNQPLATTSAAKTVTLKNISVAAVSLTSIVPSGDFAVPSKTCGASLAAGASCTFNVTFAPSLTGAVSGDVTVTFPGEGSPQRLGVTGNGLSPITLAPASLSFGTVTVGSTSAPKAVVLTNNETTTLSISHVASGDFAIASTTCGATLASHANCTMNVTFRPRQNSAITGAVTVSYNAGLSPQEVSLSGSGTGGAASPLTFTPSLLSFGNVAAGTSVSHTVTVKNSSASSVKISALAASGDYSATGCVTTLAPLGTCTMTVTFKPSVKGTIYGSVAITDNTVVSPETFEVLGVGVSPLAASPASLSFGTLTVGTTSGAKTLTLTNNLASTLSLTRSTSGDFTFAGGTCGATLAAHASCTLLVNFTPTATGAISGVATLTYGSTFSPEEVALIGTGR
jgi:Pro-kumamolisin, activation domain/Abnormal spindle-like microcephaly-assoc'd, ASPM-SPD-2-Hydin